MRAVTGPLQTGTYIVEPVSARGEFATLNKDQSKVALTKNHQSDAVKVFDHFEIKLNAYLR